MKMYIPIGNIQHGELLPGRVGRYCQKHQTVHGWLYVCHHYTEETKQEIIRADRRHKSIFVSICIAVIFLIMLIVQVGPK